MGLIGGGPGSFIGRIHRIAAELDGEARLVCGAFSSSPERSREAGEGYHLPAARAYPGYAAMIEAEKALPADERMDFAVIATPNHLHFDPARRCLENGFHVVVDKPMCFSLDEARELKAIVARSRRLLAVTYTYSGYPMVKQARALVAAGRIGAVRKIYVEYPQGWLATGLEQAGQKQADWRTDPARSGAGGAIGDIGTHAAQLAEYVSGLRIAQIDASLNTVVAGRRLDDDAAMLLRFENGASGVLFATQVAAGEENNIRIRVYGERGGVEWQQADANSLVLRMIDAPVQVLRTGSGYLDPIAAANARTPPGHPEGYLEAFANIYAAFYQALRDHERDPGIDVRDYDFPNVDDGLHGMAFVDTVVRSAQSDRKWTPFA
ncbi:MAG: Gfo/Idh/MocA family oxidoreductase [Proteobacteria bacterium]|uniref:Gfo/Idh/MocA family protein n=1 Tax=Rudaea sp. TaxID=2136325 RepID=UPI00321F6567|nr:Gfo/Idh/MocA family oxidoreductase [Pseudomonadota bacterium]